MILLASQANCRSAGSAGPSGGSDGGAPSAAGAVEGFLTAARGGNANLMASLFGTANGSISRRDPANDVEKRMRALQCYLTHDSARLVDDAPGISHGRIISVELKQRELTRKTQFNVVPGPHQRWYVESFDIQALADLCRRDAP
jgi:hypothetical protein